MIQLYRAHLEMLKLKYMTMDEYLNETFILYNVTNSSEDLYHLEGIEIPKTISNSNHFSFHDTFSLPTSLSLVTALPLAVSLGLLIIITVIGNVFVMSAICRERNLQTVGNYLVFSLSFADFMVAGLVMPLGALYELMDQQWILSPGVCEIWTTVDVLCCTASILHLVAIALDRYWAVTNIDYIRQRSKTSIGVMIFLVWVIAFIVSIAPSMGWKDDMFLHRIEEEKRCLLSQDPGYQIFATCSTFYVPLAAILILYWQIYQVARNRIRRKPGHAIRPTTILPLVCESTSFNGSAIAPDAASNHKQKSQRETVEAARERKAAKTLAIITGVFLVCWLPFFVTALVMSLCPSCDPGPRVFSFFLWLGYANSTLNPIIYTVFSPDFRKAFARQLCGRKCAK